MIPIPARHKVVEAGTRESAFCTLAILSMAEGELREVRRHVRGDHKRRIDAAITIMHIIATDTQRTYAITDNEAAQAIRAAAECRSTGTHR
ncbi:MAG: hypothetical protein LUO82_04590 [Methanomicrobiales archaeon]|nr:hypothetical protein [Methanomicrobiales archaeon]